MRMRVAFWLPRNGTSVALARQALDRIFTLFGVHVTCREEIALAVSEACTNAVKHADGAEMYQLRAEAEDSTCVIEILDDGPGLGCLVTGVMPPVTDEGGRGMAIMSITADSVEVRRRRPRGLAVRLSKRLIWEPDALGAA